MAAKHRRSPCAPPCALLHPHCSCTPPSAMHALSCLACPALHVVSSTYSEIGQRPGNLLPEAGSWQVTSCWKQKGRSGVAHRWCKRIGGTDGQWGRKTGLGGHVLSEWKKGSQAWLLCDTKRSMRRLISCPFVWLLAAGHPGLRATTTAFTANCVGGAEEGGQGATLSRQERQAQ